MLLDQYHEEEEASSVSVTFMMLLSVSGLLPNFCAHTSEVWSQCEEDLYLTARASWPIVRTRSSWKKQSTDAISFTTRATSHEKSASVAHLNGFPVPPPVFSWTNIRAPAAFCNARHLQRCHFFPHFTRSTLGNKDGHRLSHLHLKKPCKCLINPPLVAPLSRWVAVLYLHHQPSCIWHCSQDTGHPRTVNRL